MTSEAPPFWWGKPDWRAYALYPVSMLYGAIAGRRLLSAARRPVDVPVVCVGNFTVGGAGKTPLALALGRAALAAGLKPGFLSRGYGGGSGEPHRVDPVADSARHTGDEALLLAQVATTIVTPDRPEGARMLVEEGCDIIIMDDGFQSARLHFDYALLVVDAVRGLGNGHVIPGGPVRARLVDQIRFCDAVVRMGQGDAADAVVRLASRGAKAVHDASLNPLRPEAIAGRRFLAFAGIGHPEKFFDTVRACGAEVGASRAFPDHHAYRQEDMAELTALAKAGGLELITTAKDAARLSHGTPAMQAFHEKLTVLEIEARFEPESVAGDIIASAQEAWRQRTLAP